MSFGKTPSLPQFSRMPLPQPEVAGLHANMEGIAMLNALGKKPNDKPCNTIDTLIGVKSELKGDIVFSGGLRIDGKVRGNVTAKGEGNSTLVLSENATITGNVTVPHIITNGTI